MIKRMLLILVGLVAAAVMIAAATNAVDLENSTFEDGNGRYALAAAAGLVFLAAVYLLVTDLSEARWARALHHQSDRPNSYPDEDVLSERFATRPAEQASATRSAPQGLVGGPHQPEEASNQPSAPSRSAVGLFGATTPLPRASSADGLFGPRASNPEHDVAALLPHAPSALQPISSTELFTPSEHSLPTTAAPTPAPAPPHLAPAPEATPVADVPPPQALAEPVTEPAGEESTDDLADQSPIVLRDYDPGDIDRTIDENNRLAVNSLVASGTLSDQGPLTAEDIRTMLFIALSSEQLRSVLHEARDDEPIPPARPELITGTGTANTGSHPDDQLPRWQVIIEPDDSSENDPDTGGPDTGDEPPSTGYLYATGGN